MLSYKDFRNLRAKLAYVSFSSAPDTLVFVAKLSQITEDRYELVKPEAMRILRKLQKLLKEPVSKSGLKFVHIPPQDIEVAVCVDAAFATNYDESSQLGCLVMLRNSKNGDANIVHYSSSKSKRVCKSVLGAELFSMMEGFDVGFVIRDSVQRMFKRNVKLSVYTDSDSLYGLCISLPHTTERRLMIDLALLREAYERRDISNLYWIPGSANPADDLTKVDKRSGALAELLRTNKFNPRTEVWVDRDKLPVTTCTPGT